MLIDTHAHIYLERFEDDLDEVIARARAAGLTTIVMPAIDVPSIHKALALCERYEGLYAMAALHPSATQEAREADFNEVAELCDHPQVIAVGESGLDYYWDRSFDERQQHFLRRHIQLAIEKDLPIVFHNREATGDLLRIVREEREATSHPERLRGIFHCFTGTAEEAHAMIDLGFHLGLGGILTFKNSDLDQEVTEIPIERIVVETDAPYLAPEPHRGERNEPAYVRHVAEHLAQTLGRPFEEIAEITTSTARSLFQLEERERA